MAFACGIVHFRHSSLPLASLTMVCMYANTSGSWVYIFLMPPAGCKHIPRNPSVIPPSTSPLTYEHQVRDWIDISPVLQSSIQFSRIYSWTSIYVFLHIRTFDLHTNFSERITLYTYSKFDIRASLNVLEFDIRTIQSTHNKYRSMYIKVQRPHSRF
jgi:hypothetical protein